MINGSKEHKKFFSFGTTFTCKWSQSRRLEGASLHQDGQPTQMVLDLQYLLGVVNYSRSTHPKLAEFGNRLCEHTKEMSLFYGKKLQVFQLS